MKVIWPVPKIEIIPFYEIEEKRPVALVTSAPAWKAVEKHLHLPVVWKTEIAQAVESSWAALLKNMQGEVVYSVGGGLPADAAKYLAAKKNLPLVCLPTALSVDAFVTWASGIRVGGSVQYIETKIPETLVIDYEVLAQAPENIRAAGVCDVLSIATGCWDWHFAEEQGKNETGMKYIPHIAHIAQGILEGVLDCAEAAGRGEPEGLKGLLDAIALETQLLNQVGHARPEEGSEHYFAYSVENQVGAGRVHAELVCPGILIIAALQGQDIKPLKKAMKGCNIALNTIPEPIILSTLQGLAEYSNTNGYSFGIAHVLDEKRLQNINLAAILG